jgi:2',3'-cyclic-nucleotide 2'-phosphodiesterase (5'-nucleotidase family)
MISDMSILASNNTAQFAIIGSGNFRTSWTPGNITEKDLVNMFPFTDTKLVSCTMTGAILKQIMFIIQSGKKAFYQTSGFAQTATYNPTKLLTVTKINGD